MIVSSLLHGRLWQPYQRRCLRDDSRKLPACAGRAAPSWRAMLCPAFAREKSALRACYALCAVRVGKRGATCSCRHFCSLRGLTPATHLILWRNRWLRPRRPVILHGARRRSRLSLPKNPVRQRDRCDVCDVCYPRLPLVAVGRLNGPSAARNRCVRQLSRWCGEKPPCA
jgi:hypothetical protein